MIARGWDGRKDEEGGTANGYRFLFGGGDNVLELAVIVAQLREYIRNH